MGFVATQLFMSPRTPEVFDKLAINAGNNTVASGSTAKKRRAATHPAATGWAPGSR
jgi:hypothetical protein